MNDKLCYKKSYSPLNFLPPAGCDGVILDNLHTIPLTWWPDYREYFNTNCVDPRRAGVRPCNSCKVYRKYEDSPPDIPFVSACTTILPSNKDYINYIGSGI